MWRKISDHGELHEHCIHICLPEITMNPFNDHELEDEDSLSCYFDGKDIFCYPINELNFFFLGKGIFCYPMNELRGEDMSRFEKNIFIVIALRMSLFYVLYMKMMMKNMKNL